MKAPALRAFLSSGRRDLNRTSCPPDKRANQAAPRPAIPILAPWARSGPREPRAPGRGRTARSGPCPAAGTRIAPSPPGTPLWHPRGASASARRRVRHNPGRGRERATQDDMRTYTITEAADLTGLSRRRSPAGGGGSLRSVVRNGRRRIPRSELVRSGLLEDAERRPPFGGPSAPLLPRPGVGAELAETGGTEDMLAALFREVLDRFERQSQEIAQFRALTVQAESLRLTNELAAPAEACRARATAAPGAAPATATAAPQGRSTLRARSAATRHESKSRWKSCPARIWLHAGRGRSRPTHDQRGGGPRAAPARSLLHGVARGLAGSSERSLRRRGMSSSPSP